jgi:hypothetical protein
METNKTTPDGRAMVALPFKLEFVAYVEEHRFLEHMVMVGGDLDNLISLHEACVVDVLDMDTQLQAKQQGWQEILVERVK